MIKLSNLKISALSSVNVDVKADKYNILNSVWYL